ncbi:MAG TPA: HD domain-containing protein [Candidatus Paceibacterota bacterium]|nr:HD domain-containing protein [Candidatus Paceibacterota bacterium]
MAKTIEDIYAEYKIMPNLQEHMLRVAAVAFLICDNFNESLPMDDIVTACLLHDMGNIIKSNLLYFPEFVEPEGLSYWEDVKNKFIRKYGNNEHEATIKIMKELGLPDQIVALVDQIFFSLLCSHRDSNNMSIKIIHYSDGRVDPNGIVSYDERMEEAKRRYKKNNVSIGAVGEEQRKELVACGKEIEKQIFAKCKIAPEDITNETAASIISKLKDFVIHSIKTQDHGE